MITYTRDMLQDLPNDKALAMYYDYSNNFLTTEYFSEYYGISKEFAYAVIQKGREVANYRHKA